MQISEVHCVNEASLSWNQGTETKSSELETKKKKHEDIVKQTKI